MSNQPDREKHVDRYPRFARNILIALLVGAVSTSCAPTTPTPASTAIVHTVEATATPEPTHVPETVAPTATPTAVPTETPAPTPTIEAYGGHLSDEDADPSTQVEEVSEEPQPAEGEHRLISVNRSLSIKFFVDQSAPEISDPAELERFTKLRDFLPELLENRGELSFRVNEYLGVNFGEADLQKMHLSLKRNGSNFELILHDARTGEDQEVNLGTISADENFIYLDSGSGREQLAQHPREYKTTFAGAEFSIRHVVSWPGQLVTINPELVIQYIFEAIKLNPDLHTHLGRTEPFSSPEEVVEFYLEKQKKGEELLIPISVHSGEMNGRYNDVLLVPGNPFDINIFSFVAIPSDVLTNHFRQSSTINTGLRTYVENIDDEWTFVYADSGNFESYRIRPDDTETDDPTLASQIRNSEKKAFSAEAISPIYRTPVGLNSGLRSQDIPPNSTPDSLRLIIHRSDLVTRQE